MKGLGLVSGEKLKAAWPKRKEATNETRHCQQYQIMKKKRREKGSDGESKSHGSRFSYVSLTDEAR